MPDINEDDGGNAQKIYDLSQEYIAEYKALFPEGEKLTRTDMMDRQLVLDTKYLQKLDEVYNGNHEAEDLKAGHFVAPWMHCELNKILTIQVAFDRDNYFARNTDLKPDDIIDAGRVARMDCSIWEATTAHLFNIPNEDAKKLYEEQCLMSDKDQAMKIEGENDVTMPSGTSAVLPSISMKM